MPTSLPFARCTLCKKRCLARPDGKCCACRGRRWGKALCFSVADDSLQAAREARIPTYSAAALARRPIPYLRSAECRVQSAE